MSAMNWDEIDKLLYEHRGITWKIKAIKLYRARENTGFKEALHAVEARQSKLGIVTNVPANPMWPGKVSCGVCGSPARERKAGDGR